MEQKKEETSSERWYRYGTYIAMVAYVGVVFIYPAILNERGMAEAAREQENVDKNSLNKKV